MESVLEKHILPRFGDLLVEQVTETRVIEFVADLRRTTFERRKPNGDLVKTYRLSRKSILNVIGVLKLILGRKVWLQWEDIGIGRPTKAKQRYFTDSELKRIIEGTSGQHSVLFALLGGTGLRAGEVLGLQVEDIDLDGQVVHVRRGIYRGNQITPKTENAYREIDIDETLTQMLRAFLGERSSGWVFQTRKSTPLSQENLRNRVLTPLLKRLGIAHAGLHAFRHSRVTQLRRQGTSGDLQKQWIGHSSLRTGDRYSHVGEELEFRKAAAKEVGLDRVLGPKVTQTHDQSGNSDRVVKR